MSNEQKEMDAPADQAIDTDALIVVDADGNFFKLPKRIYTDANYAMEPNEGGTVRQIVRWGAALAYLPATVGVGIGTACYLVNLRSLRTDVAPPDRPGTAPGDVAPAAPFNRGRGIT